MDMQMTKTRTHEIAPNGTPNEDELVPITVRLPRWLIAKLKRSAKNNFMPINSQSIAIYRAALGDKDTDSEDA